MATTTYSLKKDGGKQISPHFKVSEFACRDGSDAVLIDDRLPQVLERIRAHFGKPVIVSSAYRTPAYNARVSGAKASQHMLGTAADINIHGITVLELAQAAEEALAHNGIPGGIGIYGSANKDTVLDNCFVHVDVRAARSRWEKTDRTANREVSVTGWDKRPYPADAPGKTPEEVTVDAALAAGILTDRAYWLDVLTGATVPKPSNVKALMDKAVAAAGGK
jgi:hypothetical protein